LVTCDTLNQSTHSIDEVAYATKDPNNRNGVLFE